MNQKFVLILLFITSLYIDSYSQLKILDDFESLKGWNIFKSEGVELDIKIVDGYKGKALRIDYNFTTGAGYGGIQKIAPLDLSGNFKFSFLLKGESTNNNFEFKLIDSSGGNVWWRNLRNYAFPKEWKQDNVRRRNIDFAWGPIIDKTLRKINRIEFTIASFSGGKESIWIDELTFEPLADSKPLPDSAEITFSSSSGNIDNVSFLSDGLLNKAWQSVGSGPQSILIDLQSICEFGGLKINWDEINFPVEYDVLVSNDGLAWENIYSCVNNGGGNSYINLKDSESKYIKINLSNSLSGKYFGIKELRILPLEYSESTNDFFINIAKDYPRGYYPRYLYEEKSYWNVIGVEEDRKEALINEDGMIEIDKNSLSLEPFLFADGKLVSWNDVKTSQNLEKNYLPIPSVNWVYKDLNLTTTAFAWGDANSSSKLFVKYRIENTGSINRSGKLFIAFRPFQVNPYYQFLNLEGGVAKIKSIELHDNSINVNNNKKIIPLTEFDGFGASEFDHGEIINFISQGILPAGSSIVDKRGSASAALSYNFNLQPDEFKEAILVIPFYPDREVNIPITKDANKTFRNSLNKFIEYWEEKLNVVNIRLPKDYQKIVNTIKSNIAYILINKDEPGIQPGSRSYERSWIRDGSLTSSALLKMGLHKEVKSFIEWYTKYQFQNGKVPCVVDSRGPDPVPENDSNGELIFLIKQYFNFSRDTTFLQSKYSNVKSAVNYIKFLIDQRSTDYYKNGNDSVRSFHGLVPESISHEGYSAKPMHSYWDDFWTLRGLKDAAEIAKILRIQEDEIYFSNLRDTFQTNLINSINLTMKNHKINYIPGCAELGDFDATSTSIALYPVFAQNILTPDAIENTFNKYYEYFSIRKTNKIDWINYTPYEVRLIGSFIMLDEIDKAKELIEYFLNDQRPEDWNHWAEVVWHDKRYPGFIGDMPHTWVGSDFINSLRNCFVYEGELDSSIIIGAGLMKEWINSEEGIEVSEMPTYYGNISYSVKKQGTIVSINIDGDVRIPEGGIILKNKYLIQDEDEITISGKLERLDEEIKITTLPCQITIKEN